jgi:hypothetical protein
MTPRFTNTILCGLVIASTLSCGEPNLYALAVRPDASIPDDIRERITRGLSPAEAALRLRALAAFWWNRQEEQLVPHLEGPADIDKVEALGGLLLHSGSDDGTGNITSAQASTLARLIAYWSSHVPERDVRDRCDKTFAAGFQSAVSAIARLPGNARVPRLWTHLLNATEYHGSRDLLSPAFWEGVEHGMPAGRVLEAVGTPQDADRAQQILDRVDWAASDVRRRSLQDSVTIMRAARLDPSVKSLPRNGERLRRAQEILGIAE